MFEITIAPHLNSDQRDTNGDGVGEVPSADVGSVSLPRSSICSDERPTSTLKSPGSARHCFALTS